MNVNSIMVTQIDDGITILQSCGELEGAWACIALNTESD